MSKHILAIVEHGASLVVQYKDRAFGGATTDVLSFDAETGKPSFAVAPALAKAFCGYVIYSAPAAASANAAGAGIVADTSVANGAQTIAAQPDVPRKLKVFITDANSSITAGVVTLVGVGPAGESITETISLTGGTAGKTTTYAYASLTSATVSSLAGAAGADHIAIGVATALGLPIPEDATSVTVYKEAAGATIASTPVDEAVGTVDATARTVVPTTAADGTKAIHFWYRYVA